MILSGKAVRDAKVVILGLTFKENCPDIRNSKVKDIINRLKEYGIKPIVVDPWANKIDAMSDYGIKLKPLSEVKEVDCIIIAVAHDEFKKLTLEEINKLYSSDINNEEKILIDAKGIFNVKDVEKMGLSYWRL